MSTVTSAPARETADRLNAASKATAWRRDHADDRDRDRLWRCYVTGALWRKRGDERRGIVRALADAERATTWTTELALCPVLVDSARACGEPTPCPLHGP